MTASPEAVSYTVELSVQPRLDPVKDQDGDGIDNRFKQRHEPELSLTDIHSVPRWSLIISNQPGTGGLMHLAVSQEYPRLLDRLRVARPPPEP